MKLLPFILLLSFAHPGLSADAPFVEAQQKKQEQAKEAEIMPLPVAELKRDTPVDFAKEIYPFIKANCIACHNSSKAKARLVLESPKTMLRGSSNGPVIVPGQGEKSLLFLSSAHRSDEPMPPEKNKSNAKNLDPDQLALLRLWIDQGAKGDGPVVATAPERWGPIGTSVLPVNALAFSADGRYVFCGRANRILVYHVATGALEAELVGEEVPAAHRDIVQSMAVSRHGVVASGGFRSLKFWRPVADPVERELAVPGEVTALAASPDGQWIAAGDQAGQVHLWKSGEWKLRSDKVHNGPVRALRITADAVFSGSDDKTVLRRLLADPAQQKKWELPQPVRDLELSGKRLAVAVQDPVVRLFDLESTNTTAVAEFKGHDKPVTFLAVVDETQLLSGTESGQVKRWKPADAAETGAINAGGTPSGFALGAGRLAVANAGMPLRFWEVASNQAKGEIKEDLEVRRDIDEQTRQLAIANRLKDHRAKQKAEAEKKKAEAEKKIDAGAKDVLAKQEAFRPHQLKYDGFAARRTRLKMDLARQQVQRDEALVAAKALAEKAEADLSAGLEKAKADFPGIEAANKKAVEDARAAFKKLEGERNTEKQQAAEAVKKLEAEAGAAIEAARKALPQPEAENGPELEAKKKALAELEAAKKSEVEAAKKSLVEKEKSVAEAIRQASEQLKKQEAELAAALNKAREGLKKREADTKAGIAKAKVDLKKREGEVAASAKQGADQLKKLDDEIKKIRGDYDKAFQAARSATFSRDAALRDAKRHHEAWLEAGAALAAMEGRVAAFDARKKELEKVLAEKPLKLGLLAATGSRVYATTEAGGLRGWDLATGSEAGDVAGVGSPTVLRSLQGGRLLAGYKDKKVKIIQPAPRWQLAGVVTNFEDRVTALAFSPDGWTLAAASGVTSRNGTIDFWNVSDLGRIGALTDPHSDTVTGMAFGPYGELLATGSTDRFVKTWRVRDFSFVHGFEGHTGYVHDVAWRADGLLLASAGADHEIKIWDFEARKQKQTLKQNSKEVTGLRYLGNGDTLVSSAGDPSVSVGNQKLPDVKDFMYAVAVSADGKWIAAGGESGELLIWNAADKKLRHRLAPRAGAGEQAAVTP